MLVISRKQGDSVKIGDDVLVKINYIDWDRGQVSLAIEAPRSVKILRTELIGARKEGNQNGQEKD